MRKKSDDTIMLNYCMCLRAPHQYTNMHYAFASTNTNIHTHLFTHIHPYTRTHTHTHTFTHIHTYTHTLIKTPTRTYSHAQAYYHADKLPVVYISCFKFAYIAGVNVAYCLHN